MATVTTGNFIDGGEILPDPFTGLTAPGELTPEERQRNEDEQRQAALRASARNTAAINARPGGYNDTKSEYEQWALDNPKLSYRQSPAERKAMLARRKSFGEALIDDPVTLGILLGPGLVTGLGAAIGPGLGFGAGAGTIATGETAGAVGTTAGTAGTAGGTTAGTVGGTTAGTTAGTVGGTTAATTTAVAAPAAAEAFTFGQGLKEVAPILAAIAPTAINEIWGGKTKEDKALLAKQEQMAKEAEARRVEVQEMRMNALGQQLLAMNPRNQMMAQMFGPDAAFQPQEFAAMTKNPMPPPQPPPQKNLPDGDPRKVAAMKKYEEDLRRYNQGNAQRSDRMMAGMKEPGPGAPPLEKRTPLPARKY